MKRTNDAKKHTIFLSLDKHPHPHKHNLAYFYIFTPTHTHTQTHTYTAITDALSLVYCIYKITGCCGRKTAQFAPESKSISALVANSAGKKELRRTHHTKPTLSVEYQACMPDAHFICSLPFHVYFKISQKLSYSFARNYFFQPWEATVCHPVYVILSRKKTKTHYYSKMKKKENRGMKLRKDLWFNLISCVCLV